MKRFAFKMYLKKGCEKEYAKRHAAIWPELKHHQRGSNHTKMVGYDGRHHGSESRQLSCQHSTGRTLPYRLKSILPRFGSPIWALVDHLVSNSCSSHVHRFPNT